MTADSLIACPDCDAIQSVSVDTRAACFRCGAVLVTKTSGGSSDRPLALAVAAIPLFVAANALPLVRMDGQAGPAAATVLGAVSALHAQRSSMLALLVLVLAIVLPAIQLGSTVYLLWGARVRRIPRAAAGAIQVLDAIRPWAQIEVLLAATLVVVGKLMSLFHVVPGVGLICMLGFLLLERAVVASFDPRSCWESPR